MKQPAWTIIGGASAAAIVGLTGVAIASGGDDGESLPRGIALKDRVNVTDTAPPPASLDALSPSLATMDANESPFDAKDADFTEDSPDPGVDVTNDSPAGAADASFTADSPDGAAGTNDSPDGAPDASVSVDSPDAADVTHDSPAGAPDASFSADSPDVNDSPVQVPAPVQNFDSPDDSAAPAAPAGGGGGVSFDSPDNS
jgi:hypothetical protein